MGFTYPLLNNKRVSILSSLASLILLCLFIPLLASGAGTENMSKEKLIELGKEIYATKGCSGCHRINGKGGTIGPDLSNEGNIVAHDEKWHYRHFKNPQSVMPGSAMPDLGLTDLEIKALTAYMMSLKSGKLPKDIEMSIKRAREKLEAAKKGIEEIKSRGFNVDALMVKYQQGWTHLETINNMIYTHNLSGVHDETDKALKMAEEIMKDIDQYREELSHRATQAIVVIVLIAIIVVLVFIKLLII